MSQENSELSKTEMDLVQYCIRALGEWQALDIYQCRLLNVEQNVALIQPSGEWDVMKETGDPANPRSLELDWKQITNPAVLKALNATRLTVADTSFCNPPETLPNGMQIHRAGVAETTPNIQDIMNIRTFIDPGLKGSDYWSEQQTNPHREVINSLKPSQKSEFYWALRFRNSSNSIVLGILESVPELKKKGYKNWILPNGDTIPLEDLQLGIMEVFPTKKWLVEVHHYFETGRSGFGGESVPNLTLANKMKRKLYVSGLNPNMGLVFAHYLLEAKLSDGSQYIVDPTGRKFGYKGPLGALVVHGKVEEYRANFPGIAGYHHSTPVSPEMYAHVRNVGNGPFTFVDRLKTFIIKYLDRRFCGYCGQIEGHHPETPRNNGQLRYRFETVALLNCSRCKKIAYCGSFCQKQDWQGHKLQCKA